MESGARRSRPQTPGTCDGGVTKAVSDPVLSLSDEEIQEKIERLTSFLSGNHLSSFPDKGLKIRVLLQQLKEEQKRRHQHRHRYLVRVVDKTRQHTMENPKTSDRGATKAVSDPMLSLSDKEIQEKIERLTSFLSGNHLSSFPDKGLKIRVLLQQLKEEQKRRRQHRHPVRVVDKTRQHTTGKTETYNGGATKAVSNPVISGGYTKYIAEAADKMIEWLKHDVPKDASKYDTFKKDLQEMSSTLLKMSQCDPLFGEGEKTTIEETSPIPGHASFTSPLSQNAAIDPLTSGIVGSSGSVSKRQRAKRKQKGFSKRDLKSIALNREKRSVHFKQAAIRESNRVEQQRAKETRAGLAAVEQDGGTNIDKPQERVSQLDAGGSSSKGPFAGKVKEEVQDWMPEDMDCIEVYKEIPLVVIDAD